MYSNREMDRDRSMENDFLVKKMILEQACYFCQHKIIQRFMPEDITTYNIHPLLPAMAALHSLVCSYYSDHDTGKAVALLQYIHSLVPQPSPELHLEYIDLLISLKTKASFYEIFTCDHSSSDNQYHMSILDKYFGKDGDPQSVAGDDEYSARAHSTMRQTIKRLLDSEKDRKIFQLNVLLRNDKSKGMHEGLADNLETYLNKIRRTLPTPQLVVNYFSLKNGTQDETEEESSSEPEGLDQLRPLSSCGKKQRMNVMLKNPQIVLQRLVKPQPSAHVISTLTSDHEEKAVTDCQLEDSSQDEGDSKVDSPATPRGYKTPAVASVQEAGIKKLDPKGNRVMGSIARKKKFLVGSPTTSSDDSSCSFLSLKKMRGGRPSFMSPEIAMTSTTPSGQRPNESGHKPDGLESAQSSSGGVKREKKKKSSLLVHRRKKTLPKKSVSPQTSHSGIVRRVNHKHLGKQAMVHFAEESDYVSESDCESPLLKNTPLCDLTETARRTC